MNCIPSHHFSANLSNKTTVCPPNIWFYSGNSACTLQWILFCLRLQEWGQRCKVSVAQPIKIHSSRMTLRNTSRLPCNQPSTSSWRQAASRETLTGHISVCLFIHLHLQHAWTCVVGLFFWLTYSKCALQIFDDHKFDFKFTSSLLAGAGGVDADQQSVESEMSTVAKVFEHTEVS